jgi:hypothetical protein
MAIELDLFSGNNYQSTIRRYCDHLGWSIHDINDQRTILKFTASSGTSQTVFILRYETTLEFSCPSGVKFSNRENVPGWMSSLLLGENSKYKLGFWCIENISSQEVFSIMHNAEISLIDVNYFQRVIFQLVEECDKFEQSISRALASH